MPIRIERIALPTPNPVQWVPLPQLIGARALIRGSSLLGAPTEESAAYQDDSNSVIIEVTTQDGTSELHTDAGAPRVYSFRSPILAARMNVREPLRTNPPPEGGYYFTLQVAYGEDAAIGP
jgi:hypothetical protein